MGEINPSDNPVLSFVLMAFVLVILPAIILFIALVIVGE